MADQKQGFPFLIKQAQIPAGEIKPRHLAATPTLANGDIYYSDGGKFVRLPAKTSGVLSIQSGVPSWIQGVSGTITIPKLTTTNGSITVVNGIITAFVNPT